MYSHFHKDFPFNWNSKWIVPTYAGGLEPFAWHSPDESKPFANVNRTTLRLTGTSTAPLVRGGLARDPLTGQMVRQADRAANPQEEKRLQILWLDESFQKYYRVKQKDFSV